MREAVIAYWFGRSRCPHPFKAIGATRVPPARPFRERAGDDGVPPVLCRGMPLCRRSRQSPRICRVSPGLTAETARAGSLVFERTSGRVPSTIAADGGGSCPGRTGGTPSVRTARSKLCPIIRWFTSPMPAYAAWAGKALFDQPNYSREALAMRRRRITAAAACFPAPAHAWVPGRRAAAGDRPIPRAGDPPARPSGDASVRKRPAARGAARRLARPNSLP